MLSTAEETTFRTARAVLAIMLLLVVGVSWPMRALGLLPAGPPFDPATFGLDSLVASGFLAAGALFMLLPRRSLEWAGVLVLALLLEVHLFRGRPQEWPLLVRLPTIGIGFGLAGLLDLAFRSLFDRGPERERARGLLTLGALLVVSPSVIGLGHDLVIAATPLVWDQFGYAVDGAWGFQPTFLVLGALRRSQFLWLACVLAYVHLPLWMMLTLAMSLRRPGRTSGNVLASLALLGLAGPILYNLVPMVGLEPLAGNLFPFGPPPPVPDPPGLVPAPAHLTRNSIPSLHTAWILVLFWNTRWMGRWVSWPGLVVLLLTLGGTLISGHYVVDLAVGVPFALLFQGLMARPTAGNRSWRLQAVAGGAAVTLLSLGALRWMPGFLIAHPALTVSAQVAMVLGSLLVEDRLARATLADGGWIPEEAQPA